MGWANEMGKTNRQYWITPSVINCGADAGQFGGNMYTRISAAILLAAALLYNVVDPAYGGDAVTITS